MSAHLSGCELGPVYVGGGGLFVVYTINTLLFI